MGSMLCLATLAIFPQTFSVLYPPPRLLLILRVIHLMEITIISIMVTTIEVMEANTTGIITIEATTRVIITIITSTIETDTAIEMEEAENLVNFGWIEVIAKKRTDATMLIPADDR